MLMTSDGKLQVVLCSTEIKVIDWKNVASFQKAAGMGTSPCIFFAIRNQTCANDDVLLFSVISMFTEDEVE